jgi:hypothetical protein
MSNPAPVVLYGAAGGSEAADHDRYVQQHHNSRTEPRGGREAPIPLLFIVTVVSDDTLCAI